MKKQWTSGSWFPSELISEILLRLPAKSVGRFRCVSKLWLSITTDPCFIKSSYSSSQPIHRYPMKVPGEYCYFSRMDSVHGLICIEDVDSKMPRVWNPTTGQFLPLPKPNMSSRHVNVFLGYDPVEGKESWRTVKTNLKHRCCGHASGQCIKGVIYYLASSNQWDDTVIMSFDVRSEMFRMIELPSGIHDDVLITYEGRLASIDEDNDKRLWSLEDADKHKWSFQDFLSPLHRLFELQGSTHAGEFIYVPFNFPKPPDIEVFDPVRNTRKRFKFEGILDKELGHNVKAFPNHIESLMPL
ncbi:hypothetical protein Bca101_053358 [Brassica carinata]